MLTQKLMGAGGVGGGATPFNLSGGFETNTNEGFSTGILSTSDVRTGIYALKIPKNTTTEKTISEPNMNGLTVTFSFWATNAANRGTSLVTMSYRYGAGTYVPLVTSFGVTRGLYSFISGDFEVTSDDTIEFQLLVEDRDAQIDDWSIVGV